MEGDLERSIRRWRDALDQAAHLPAEGAQELEDHLRDEIDGLIRAGLAPDEAFLVAVRRMGNIHQVARQLASIDADQAWRQHFDDGPGRPPGPATSARETTLVIAAALLAALLGQVPRAFGVTLDDREGLQLYLRNLSLFVVPVLILVYWVHRRFSLRILAFLGALVLAAVAAANLYPFVPGRSWTAALMAYHLPLLLWLALGVAYAGDGWRTVRLPLDFLRFTGEVALYSVLIGCGGLVFLALVQVFFSAVGLDPWLLQLLLVEVVGLGGLLGLPVVAAYLVEKKRSLVENLAPVLARIFIPMFLLMMLAFIGTVAVAGKGAFADREMLIWLNVLLMLVTGMVLYDLSARRDEPERGRGLGLQHLLNLGLILAALVINGIALYGISVRLAEFGFSPNRTAALGQNLLLMVNLAGLAAAYLGLARGRGSLSRMLTWQVRYMPVYFVWFAFVVFGFPPLFGFR